MYRFFIVFFTFTSAFAFLSASCPCDSIPGFESAYQSANVVFRGVPVKVIPNWVSGGLKATFRVSESWKRSIETWFTLNVPEPANCGISFTENKDWLVYVYKTHSYNTDSCSRTRPAARAAEDIVRLGKSMSPAVNSSINRWMLIMGGMVFAGMAFIAFVVMRKRIFRANSR